MERPSGNAEYRVFRSCQDDAPMENENCCEFDESIEPVLKYMSDRAVSLVAPNFSLTVLTCEMQISIFGQKGLELRVP